MVITDIPVAEDKVYLQPLQGFLPGISISMLRLDLLHPHISGNKWYKLKHNIAEARAQGKKTLLSFGGAYSNHLLALAASAAHYGMTSVGMVRGLHAATVRTPLLQQCLDYGMQLQFLEREQYARKTAADFLVAINAAYPDVCIIPEGGANAAGRTGAGEIAARIPADNTHIILSVGTGTTFAGLRNVLPAQQYLLGCVPMKGGSYLREEIQPLLDKGQDINWSLTDEFHFGGFGKSSAELSSFMDEFRQSYKTELDRVYTAKMMYGLRMLATQGYFPPGSRILAIHSGGLGGN